MLKEIVANDFIHHTGESAVSNHAEGLRQFMTLLHAGLPDIYIDIQEQISENGLVATCNLYGRPILPEKS